MNEEFDVIRAHTYHTYHILSTIGGFEEAVTENRPYRKGTGRNETLPILQNLARSGSLDDNVVGVLTENYDEIDRMRSDVQEISSSEYLDFVSQNAGAGRSLSRV